MRTNPVAAPRFPLMKVAMRGIRVNLSRFLLTGLAVAIGTAFLTSALTLHGHFTDALRQAASADALSDIYVLGKENGSDGQREQLPTRLLTSVERAPNVASAEALWETPGALYHLDGSVVATSGVPVVYGPTPEGQAWPKWVEGRAPTSTNEVALEKTGAQRARLHTSDRLQVAYGEGREDAVISGVYELEVGTPSLVSVGLSPASANAWANQLDKVDAFGVMLKKGASAEQAATALQEVLGAQAEVLTHSEYSTYLEQGASQEARVGSILFVAFFAYALLLSAFIISNTFRLVTNASAGEYASLRMAGATDPQVFGLVAIQAAGVGLIGSAVGAGLGVLAVKGVQAGFSLIGSSFFDVLVGDTHASPSALATAFIVGVLVTLASAIPAAQKASHSSPFAAASLADEGATPKFKGRTAASFGLIATGLTGLVLGVVRLPTAPSVFLVAGIVLFSTGVVVASPMLLRAAARRASKTLTGEPEKGRIPLLLALRDIEGHPRRCAAGAAALIVGVGLVVGGATLAKSYAKSFTASTRAHVETDFVVAPASPLSPLPTEVAQLLQSVPGVASVEDQVGFATLNVAGAGSHFESARALLVDPSYLGSNLTFTLIGGNYPAQADEVVVSPALRDTLNVQVGDELQVKGPDADTQVKVVGVAENLFEGAKLLGSPELLSSSSSAQFPALAFVTLDEGASVLGVEDTLEELTSTMAGVHVHKYEDLATAGVEVSDEVVTILNTVLVFTFLVTLLTFASTTSLSTTERKRQFGLLADIGMARPSIEKTALAGALFTSMYGTILGVGLGLGLGWVAQRFLSGLGVHLFSLPWETVASALVLAPLVAVVAAWGPARNASKPQRSDEVLVA